MAKLLIIYSGGTSKSDGVYNALINSGHDVSRINDAHTSLTVEYGTTFDIVFANNQSRNIDITKAIFDAGTPVVAGMFDSPATNITSAAVTLGMINKETKLNGQRPIGIPYVNDVLINSTAYTEYNFFGTSTYISNVLTDDGFAPGAYVISNRALNQTYNNQITGLVCRKGALNTFGKPFPADGAFLGMYFSYSPTPEGLSYLNDVIDWILEGKTVKVNVKAKDGMPLSRPVKLFRKDNNTLVYGVQSDSNGIAELRLRKNTEYYAIAFDEPTGTKNAEIVDQIIFG